MAIWLDIIGSFVFGALLTLNVLRLNSDMTAQAYESSFTYMAQRNAAAIAEVMEDDLRKMGFGVTGTSITLADSSQIRFLADLEEDGAVDTLYYYVGSLSEADDTPNPADRILYRVLNGVAPPGMRLGVTKFALSYFGANGDSLALPVTPGNIQQIRVDLTVESTAPYGTTYARAFMQLRIRPRNLGS